MHQGYRERPLTPSSERSSEQWRVAMGHAQRENQERLQQIISLRHQNDVSWKAVGNVYLLETLFRNAFASRELDGREVDLCIADIVVNAADLITTPAEDLVDSSISPAEDQVIEEILYNVAGYTFLPDDDPEFLNEVLEHVVDLGMDPDQAERRIARLPSGMFMSESAKLRRKYENYK